MRPESKFDVAGGARILRALGKALRVKMRDPFSLPQLGWDSRFVDDGEPLLRALAQKRRFVRLVSIAPKLVC
jgi:hypothetical protein